MDRHALTNRGEQVGDRVDRIGEVAPGPRTVATASQCIGLGTWGTGATRGEWCCEAMRGDRRIRWSARVERPVRITSAGIGPAQPDRALMSLRTGRSNRLGNSSSWHLPPDWGGSSVPLSGSYHETSTIWNMCPHRCALRWRSRHPPLRCPPARWLPPPPTPRRKTTSRTATQRVATAKARRTKRRGGE